MARATLEIQVSGSADCRRAFGEIVQVSRRAHDALRADARRTGAAVERSLADQTRAALRTAERVYEASAQAEARKVATARAGAAARTTIASAETRAEQAAWAAAARAYARVEHQRTQVTEREARRRSAVVARELRERAALTGGGRGGGRGGGSRGGTSVGGVLGVVDRIAGVAGAAGDVAGRAQEDFAPIEARLNRALFQASPDNGEITARRGQLLAYAQSRRMDVGQVAEAAAQAQEQFAALGDRSMTRGQRDARMGAFLTNMGEAHDLGQDPAQFARLAGALASSGVQGHSQTQVMRHLAGISMRGGVEVGNLTREALAPLMAAIARVQGDGPEAITRAITEQVSALEVLAPRGLTPRRGGMALSMMQSSLGTGRTQEAVLTHVRDRFGRDSALERQMFERGAGGRMALRQAYRDPFAFGEALSSSVGDDPDALRNLLGTETSRRTGHTMRQALTQPQREALAALAQRGATGRTGYEEMRSIREGAALTAVDAEQGRALFGGETAAGLTFNRQQAMFNALYGPAGQQAENVRTLQAQHPLVSAMAGQLPGGGALLQMVAGAMTAGDRAAGVRQPGGAGASSLPAIGANGLPVTLHAPVRIDPTSVTALANAIRQNPPVIREDPHARPLAETAERSARGATPAP